MVVILSTFCHKSAGPINRQYFENVRGEVHRWNNFQIILEKRWLGMSLYQPLLELLVQYPIILFEPLQIFELNFQNPYLPVNSSDLHSIIGYKYSSPSNVCQRPISQTIFHRNSNSMEISCCSHPSCSEVIVKEFCTWHDSCAVVACAKFCSDIMPCNGVTRKTDFPSNLNCDGKINREMDPWMTCFITSKFLHIKLYFNAEFVIHAITWRYSTIKNIKIFIYKNLTKPKTYQPERVVTGSGDRDDKVIGIDGDGVLIHHIIEVDDSSATRHTGTVVSMETTCMESEKKSFCQQTSMG